MEYLTVLERLRIEPNFWASHEYFLRAKLTEEKIASDIIAVMDEGVAVLPPLSLKKGGCVSVPGLGVWSDFYGNSFGDKTPSFLDYEYLYNPLDFNAMEGGKWATFRKNVKKYPRRNSDLYYRPLDYCSVDDRNSVISVLSQWLEGVEEEIEDDSVLEDFCLNGFLRYGLFELDRLVGFNVWDYSWKYANFRYCICRPEPFLSEYMRYLFYTVNCTDFTYVNDGGILNRPKLKEFKERMNPVRVREVYSWL